MAIDLCTTTAPVKGVVRFVPSDFKAAFPEFAAIADPRLQMNFDTATYFLNNSCGSYVCDAPTRERLLNYLTAHMTALFDGVNGQPPSGVVGRVSGATEGSVSAQFDMGSVVGDQAWFDQTRWGALYWAMTSKFRTFRYVPPVDACGELPYFGPGCC